METERVVSYNGTFNWVQSTSLSFVLYLKQFYEIELGVVALNVLISIVSHLKLHVRSFDYYQQ